MKKTPILILTVISIGCKGQTVRLDTSLNRLWYKPIIEIRFYPNKTSDTVINDTLGTIRYLLKEVKHLDSLSDALRELINYPENFYFKTAANKKKFEKKLDECVRLTYRN